jgi:nucleoside phosphorylase
MAEFLAKHPEAKQVLLLGTAGSLKNLPIGSLWAAGRLGWSDSLRAGGIGYIPCPPPELEAELELGLPKVGVLTGFGVTTKRAVADAFGADWLLEHMEAGAVALACRRAGVRFGAVLGVSNEVGEDAHQQWKENRLEVEKTVQEWVKSHI